QRLPSVVAVREHPEVLWLRRMIAHVQQQPAVGELDHLAFVGARVRAGAERPAPSRLIAEKGMCAVDSSLRFRVISRYHESTASDLDPDSWPGCVPGPVRGLDARGDL